MKRLLFSLAAVLFSMTLSSAVTTGKQAEVKQPQSILVTVGDDTVLCGDPNESIHLVTETKPLPRDPTDLPLGNPTYVWDFGTLDGVDNGDGTATIFSDVEAEYDVTVSCEQEFLGADQVAYVESTITSAKSP